MIKAYIAYLKYIIRHKYFVLCACRKTKCSLWRGLIHDWSKFLPSEFGPYMRCFYNPDGSSKYEETEEFNLAWLKHQHRNKHHHQYWVLKCDDGKSQALEIPEIYCKEMISDWIGAGLAQGKPDVKQWYDKSKDKMILHPKTRIQVEELLKGL